MNLKKEKINALKNNQRKYSNNLSSIPSLLNKNIHNKAYTNNENNNNTSEGEDANDNENNNNNNNNNYLLNREKYIYRPITIFSEVFNSSSVQTLLAIGNRPAPLSLVGYYLNCLGNFTVDFINSKYNKNILLNRAEVKQIKLFNNQEFGILVTRSINHFNNNNNYDKLNNNNNNASDNSDKNNLNQIIIKTKSLVIATGGKQDELNPYYSKILEFKGVNNVFRSDYILREEGYEKILKTMIDSYLINVPNPQQNENSNLLNLKKKKIVIIGGSHSGFSCAWILLNDPSTYKNIKIGTDYKPKFNPNCAECLKYTAKYKYLLNQSLSAAKKTSSDNIRETAEESKEDKEISKTIEPQEDSNSYYDNLESKMLENEFIEKEINSINYEEELERLKHCNCLGAVKSHIWEYTSFKELENKDLFLLKNILENAEAVKANSEEEKINNKNESILITEKEKYTSNLESKAQENKNLLNNFISYLKTNLIEIQILFREHIRVYYPSEQDALDDNYTVYNKKEAINKQGKIYPFIGIRGDAKELYRKIIKGEEKRITFLKTSSNEEQKRYIQDSDYVIWACGYNSNNLKVLDSKNHPIEFLLEDGGMVEVSKQLNILNKNKEPIKNLFGIGQGYSTKAPEIINGKKARADSIHLYNTHISHRLYNSLQGLFSKNNIDFHYKNPNGIGVNNNINNNLNSINIYNQNNNNNAGNTGFGNNTNNNVNMRRKIAERAALPLASYQAGNFGNADVNLNYRKNSGGLVNEEVNNAFKQTGLNNNNNNILSSNNQIYNNRISKFGNNNNNNVNYKLNNLSSINNQDANLTGKNNFYHIKISKMITLKPNNNYLNQNLDGVNNNRAITNYKNKIINNKIQVNSSSNNPQFYNKSKNFLNKETEKTLENATINLNNTADFAENINTIPEYPNLKNKKNDFENNNINNNNNSFEEKDREAKEKNSAANFHKNKIFINNNINTNNQLKNQNNLKRKPLTSFQNEGINVHRKRSLNNQQSRFNANKLLNQNEFSDKKKTKNLNENENFKKASTENNKFEKKFLEKNQINNNKNNTKNSQFSLGVADEINKKIQIQMEKISNDEILKTYNDSAYSGNSKANSNLPGFNSLNEMNKQTYLNNNRKENFSNTFSNKKYSGSNFNEKADFELTSRNNNDFSKTERKSDEKHSFPRENMSLKVNSLVEDSGNMLITN